MPKDLKGNEITQEQFAALPAADQAAITAAADKSKIPGPAPEIEASQIKGLKELMTETLTEFAAQQPQEEEEGTPQATEQRIVQPTDQDPLNQVIGNVVNPALADAKLESLSATDAAVFYATNPQAAKHSKEIEGAFQSLKAQGKAFTREAVYEWWKGKNFQKLHEELVEEDKKKVAEAESSQTVDESGRPVISSPKINYDKPDETSDEDLGKAVEGQTF